VIPVGSQENQELLQARKESGALHSRVLFDCGCAPAGPVWLDPARPQAFVK